MRGFDAKFVTDDITGSALASRLVSGDRETSFAMIDLGQGMTSAPPALASRVLEFRDGVDGPSMDAEDKEARHVAVLEFRASREATPVGCARVRVAAGTRDGFQVSMSRLVVARSDTQVRRWTHAWLMSELLRVAMQHRRPSALAAVGPELENDLTDLGIVFERIGRPQHRPGNPTILLRVNVLASTQRLRHDHRIPKLAVTTWTDSTA